jgi:FkbM family methyltransferase
MPLLKRAREWVRRTGFDVVRFPHPGSLGAHLRILFQRLDIQTVLDVGGHQGEYALFLRRLGFHGAIHSFEPIQESLEILTRAMRGDRSWTGHPLAVGAKDGEVDLHVMRSSGFTSVHAPTAYARERFGDAVRAEDVVRVPIRRLDSISADLDGREGAGIFLKIDTQGSEMDVLAGAEGILDRVEAIQAELPLRQVYHGVPPLWDVLPRFRELGYGASGFFPVSIDRSDLSLVEVDCVAVRTGRPSSRSEAG